ncbi:hypothetical protein [Steroidobacter cummioxidans]|uniref:hypothetical protein n=1 Tax=Steroidobacter cummioxidans TaxID=1803913 RepID=UPI000E311EE4|nr:hypothetical protein [Steroidobacter cummioxidans]
MSDHNCLARTATQFRKGVYPNAWAVADVRRLRELAEQGISPGQVAKLLRRSESAVRNKACLHGISFRRQVQKTATVEAQLEQVEASVASC